MAFAVYLDYNATAPIRPQAAQAVRDALAHLGNPSSIHAQGRRARRLLEDAREAVAFLVGAEPPDVVFTSGGTEANDLALHGLPGEVVLVSAIEHDSILKSVPDAGTVPVDRAGRIEVSALEDLLAKAPGRALVSVMLANNETGAVQPIAEVTEAARRHGALVHCDASQAAGKLPVSFTALGVDAMTLSAHKFGGPPGVGALIVASGTELSARIRGGGQERRRRAGTENLPGIAGFGAAAVAAASEDLPNPRVRSLRDALERQVAAAVPQVRRFGADEPRLANTACFGVPGWRAETQVMGLDLAGVAVSAGSACSSGKVEMSHVLRAMGASPDEAACSIRVSLGWASSQSDVDSFIAAWGDLYKRHVARPAKVPAA